MESGLCCDYYLEAGFAASVDGVVWPPTKRRYHVVHQLVAEKCTCTSKRNKCWMEKSLLRSSKSFSRGIGYHLALFNENVQGLWWKNWWEHGHHVDPLQGSQTGQHTGSGKGKWLPVCPELCQPGQGTIKTAAAAVWEGSKEEDRGSTEEEKVPEGLAKCLTARYYWAALMCVFLPSCYFKLRIL